MNQVKIAPSILAADFARLGEQIVAAESGGADWIHVDVMDGHFVPPISMGYAVCAAARKCTTLPLDVHLMVVAPERHVQAFADAGAAVITVHWEACPHLHRVLEQIRAAGVRAGVALNPATPVSVLEEILPDVDLVLVMSVDPGWGGQGYLAASTRKLQRVRTMLGERGLETTEVQVDGGIDLETAADAARGGASVLVAGSAVYNSRGSVAENLAKLRRVLDGVEPAWVVKSANTEDLKSSAARLTGSSPVPGTG